MLGRTLKVHRNTLSTLSDEFQVERGKFARVPIEIDVRKKLRSNVRVGRRVFGVEYEGPGLICFSCEKYEHKKDDCPIYKEVQEGKEGMKEASNNNGVLEKL